MFMKMSVLWTFYTFRYISDHVSRSCSSDASPQEFLTRRASNEYLCDYHKHADNINCYLCKQGLVKDRFSSSKQYKPGASYRYDNFQYQRSGSAS
jgi:hypothetical protein